MGETSNAVVMPVRQPTIANDPPQTARVLLSIVVPCHNEEANLPILHERLSAALQNLGMDWELIIVDDHSGDGSFPVVKSLSATDPRVKALRLARNVGSHLAITCGVEHAEGDAIVVLAADLQDPPELIPQMVEHWQAGSQIIWAVRERRLGISLFDRLSSRLFHRVMAWIIGTADINPGGVDFFVIDRVVGQALTAHRETNISIFALLQWMGFRQSKIHYTKQARAYGKSSWSLRKKLKLFFDSVTSFSFLPIRTMSLLGVIAAAIGLVYAMFVILNSFVGKAPSGWSSLIVVVLVLGGIQIIMLGILGEYLWRNLSETRRRPRYLIEDKIGFENSPTDASVAPRTVISAKRLEKR